jgi:hypothetical protein
MQKQKTPKSKTEDFNCSAPCEKGCSSDASSKRKHRTADVPLNRVMAYRFEPLIVRLVEKKGFERAEAENLYTDMLRFLYLCGTVGKTLAPSERVDLVWHEFLLFTREYQNFCRSMFGFFVHHNPVESGKRPAPKKGKSVVATTLKAARETFGELSPNWNFPGASSYNCVKCSTPSTSCDSN